MELWFRIVLFIILMIVVYLISRFYFDYDPFEGILESFQGIEFNMTALILTLLLSAMLWGIIWLTPFWATPENYRITQITGIPMKIFLSVAIVIVGYPLALNALNK